MLTDKSTGKRPLGRLRGTYEDSIRMNLEEIGINEGKSRRLRWAGHVARMEEGRSAFKILTGKPTGKRLLGRLRGRWEDSIRMNLEEIGINEDKSRRLRWAGHVARMGRKECFQNFNR